MTIKTFQPKQQGSSSEVRSSSSSYVHVIHVVSPPVVPELNVQYIEIPRDSQARIYILINFSRLIIDRSTFIFNL